MLAIVGVVVLVLGFALGSEVLTVSAGVLIAAGVLWFVLAAIGDPVEREGPPSST